MADEPQGCARVTGALVPEKGNHLQSTEITDNRKEKPMTPHVGQKDIITYLNKLIPQNGGFGYNFRHGEGNSDAHLKSSLMSSSIDILIHNGTLMLGTWQGCYFTEFDGPRNRKVYVQLQGES
jgi:secondary thiamine-phosphate synthase enzyme